MKEPLVQFLTKEIDPQALDQTWPQVEHRLTNRAWHAGARWGAALAFVAALLIAVGWWKWPGHVETARPNALHLHDGAALAVLSSPSRTLRTELDDGSVVTLDPGSVLAPTHNDAHAVGWQLVLGSATFDVRPHGPRTWTVDAGTARVTVLGTRFRVQRDSERVHVAVERGLVLVEDTRDPSRGQRLGPGESADVLTAPFAATTVAPVESWVPIPAPPNSNTLTPPASSTARPHDDDHDDSNELPSTPASSTPATRSWQAVAKEDGRPAAYALLTAEGIAREARGSSNADDLLALADIARLSGHPADAVTPLEQLVTHHARDARAPQAAFTLGKLQLDVLGASEAAAHSFERALALGLPNALREDAYVRRVEALAKAGEPRAAAAARDQYLSAFPSGRHRLTVEKWAP